MGARSRKQRRSQPASGGSSLCCAGQRRRHAEHHGRLLLHRSGGRGPRGCAAGLLRLLTSGRAVGRLERAWRRTRRRPRCWPTTPPHKWTPCWETTARRARTTRRPPSHARARTKTSSQPTKSPRRWLVAYRSAADQDTATASSITAALLIGEQILGPGRLTVKLDSSPQQRLQRGPDHAHHGRSERGQLHPDPGGEPLEHRAHLQLDAWPRAPLCLPVPAWHGLQLRGVPGRLEHGQDAQSCEAAPSLHSSWSQPTLPCAVSPSSSRACRSVTETDSPSKAEALICMLYRSSVPADCCTRSGIKPLKAPKCSFGGTKKSRRSVLRHLHGRAKEGACGASPSWRLCPACAGSRRSSISPASARCSRRRRSSHREAGRGHVGENCLAW